MMLWTDRLGTFNYILLFKIANGSHTLKLPRRITTSLLLVLMLPRKVLTLPKLVLTLPRKALTLPCMVLTLPRKVPTLPCVVLGLPPKALTLSCVVLTLPCGVLTLLRIALTLPQLRHSVLEGQTLRQGQEPGLLERLVHLFRCEETQVAEGREAFLPKHAACVLRQAVLNAPRPQLVLCQQQKEKRKVQQAPWYEKREVCQYKKKKAQSHFTNE